MKYCIIAVGCLVCAAAASGIERASEPTPEMQLAKVRRIFVEQLGGGATSDQMRDMIIAALQASGLFVITENQERADATLRGSSDDRVYTEEHNTSDSIGLHSNAGTSSGSRNSTSTSSSSRRYGGAGITDSESSRIQEHRHEASASIRLLDEDGDVIWSTTQESGGGKFRGAMADVADKIARQLIADTRKARIQNPPIPATMRE